MRGFTLIEVLIYSALFGVAAVFLVNILVGVTTVEVRQVSKNEVNAQLAFITDTIERLVQDSSVIENAPGISDNILVLRMASTSLDKTFIYASGTEIYIEQGGFAKGERAPLSLTDKNVRVEQFIVTKFESAGGRAIVHTDLTLSYVSQNPKSKFSRSWSGAITRASAATFDNSLLPNSGNLFDLGDTVLRWKNAYFSGDVSVGGKIGIGLSPTAAFPLAVKGNIGVTVPASGLVLKAPNGTSCFLISITNTGALSTSTAVCP